MNDKSKTIISWVLCIIVVSILSSLIVFMRDDAGFGVDSYSPMFSTGDSINIYGIWSGAYFVALLTLLPAGICLLLYKIILRTKGQKIFVGLVIGLLSVIVIAIEITFINGAGLIVKDFTMSPRDFVAAKDSELVQQKVSELKSKEVSKLCDDAFGIYIDNSILSDSENKKREYSFDRVLFGITISQSNPEIERLLDLTDTKKQCLTRYKEQGEKNFMDGAYKKADAYYLTAMKLVDENSDIYMDISKNHDLMKIMIGAES